MFNMRQETIRENSTNGPTYIKGQTYFKNDHVIHLSVDQNLNTVVAIVKGSTNHRVRIIFTAAGNIHDVACSCNAFSSYWGYCHHVVAVLLVLRESKSEINKPAHASNEAINVASKKSAKTSDPKFPEQNNNSDGSTPAISSDLAGKSKESSISQSQGRKNSLEFKRQVLRLIELYDTKAKQELILKTTIKVNLVGGLTELSFALGRADDHLPAITNTESFAKALSRNMPFAVDRTFTYDPLLHKFSKEDQPVVDFLITAYENNYTSVFAGKNCNKQKDVLSLNSKDFAFFLPLAAKSNNVTWIKSKTDLAKEVLVKEEDLPLEIYLFEAENDDFIYLQIRCGDDTRQLTCARNIFLVDDVFYLPPRKHMVLLEPLLTLYLTSSFNGVLLSNTEAGMLLSGLLPLISDFCQLLADHKITSKLVKDQLQIECLLDNQEKGITAEIFFNYGETRFNAFQNAKNINSRLLIRDYKKEQEFIYSLQELGFYVFGSQMILDNNKKIFHFLDQEIDKIAQIATLHKGKGLKNIRILAAPKLRFDLSLDQNNHLLLQMDWDNMAKQEQKLYLQAQKNKLKYYQNGQNNFRKVDLSESKQLLSFLQLLELWDIPYQVNQKNKRAQFLLPHFRVFALANIQGTFLRIDESVHKILLHLAEPSRLNFRLPADLKANLRPYQKEGFQWLCTLHHYRLGGILADDMGLGKTLQTIAFITEQRKRSHKPVLIVAPTALLYNWLYEINRFSPQLKAIVSTGTKEKRAKILADSKKQDCIITSYALMRRDINILKKINFCCCFLDEAQNIKNPATVNAKYVKQIQCECAFALTGTPIENRLTELWSIFDYILPGYLMGQKHFKENFEGPLQQLAQLELEHEACSDNGQNELALKQAELLQHLRAQTQPFILRRLKKDVLAELPAKLDTTIICDMTQAQRKLYRQTWRQTRQTLDESSFDKANGQNNILILTLLTRLRQICCHPALYLKDYQGGSDKLNLLIEILEERISSGHRVLVFSQFISMLNIIAATWTDLGYDLPLRMDGQTSAAQRHQLVERFNQGENNIFLISLKAGGLGLNLTGADTVVHYDPWWNPAVEEQASDRAYRIGQESPVQVIKLYTRDSIEEKILELQSNKKILFDAVVRPEESILNKMSISQIKALFD